MVGVRVLRSGGKLTRVETRYLWGAVDWVLELCLTLLAVVLVLIVLRVLWLGWRRLRQIQ
jgi:hypothetical protein